MVKGISRRVIVVRAPDPRFFEQAVFFLREDVLHRDGVTADQIVDEAQRLAAACLQSPPQAQTRRKAAVSAVRWIALGCALSSLVWGLICLL